MSIRGRVRGSQEQDSGQDARAKESPCVAQHKELLGPEDYKRLNYGKDVPFDAELQYLKPHMLAQALVHQELVLAQALVHMLAQALVHHKFVMDLPDGIWTDEKIGKTAPCRIMALKAYSRTQAKFWYVDFLSYHILIVVIFNCLCEEVQRKA